MHRVLTSFTVLCIFSSSALAAEELKGRAEVNWRYGNERSIAMTEFWAPFAQNEALGNILYGSLRMMGDNQDNYEGNLGLGYREITSAPSSAMV